jgi:phosphoribosylformylglycinamidine synthase
MKHKLAVIQFPGSNCEYETLRAAAYYGFDAHILKWNTPPAELDRFQVFIIPGGFSYQDRIRAGVISSKLQITKNLFQQAMLGKPILGICNGCQILAEAGLIPDLEEQQQIEIHLAPNIKNNAPLGFICEWIYLKIELPEKNVFTRFFNANEILPIPINNQEGCFVLKENIKQKINQITVLKYCSVNGEEKSFPINPNGSYANIAGLSNLKGNVLGLMPHPERAMFLKQIPNWIEGPWPQEKKDKFLKNQDGDGPWSKMMLGVLNYLN